DVIDVVTDDMPFLVDSMTMTLAGHGISADLVVHPQLLVRRDLSGTLREVIHPIEGQRPLDRPRIPSRGAAPDEITESWSDIEVIRLAEGRGEAIAADLERALGDVRLAVEDYPKMRATALRLATELRQPGDEARTEIEELLRWLVDGHFTFIGYREYALVRE